MKAKGIRSILRDHYNFENELSGYTINVDSVTQVEGKQYKCRIIFNYEMNDEALIS